MLLAAIAALPALQTAPRGQTIGRGTVHLEGLPTGPGNLLPPLTHMFGGGESITHLDPTQLRPAMRHNDYSGSWDFSVPDIVYGVGVDAVPMGSDPDQSNSRLLPYRLNDFYLLGNTSGAVPSYKPLDAATIELAGTGGLTASVTPQFGGKVFALKWEGIDLVYRNRAHQPQVNGILNGQVRRVASMAGPASAPSRRQASRALPTTPPPSTHTRRARAQTLGGIEINWTPGNLGHSFHTESDVWAAKIPTERGDVLRLYEFDR